MRRRGFSVLATVCMLAFAAGMIAMALNTLQRSSSRNLYTLEEHRQLTNLSRSCLAEALYSMEIRLEQGSLQGNFSWTDWCSGFDDGADHAVPLKWCTTYAEQMTRDPRFIAYEIKDQQVMAHLVAALPRAGGLSGRVGALDLTVTCTVTRHRPDHYAKLTLTERHAFWISDAATPFSGKGQRHFELLPTPAATFLRYD